jgi:hypothetical protein
MRKGLNTTAPCVGKTFILDLAHVRVPHCQERNSQVYVRDDFCHPTTGLVLDANTGNPIRGFTSDTLPAFIGDLVLYFHDGTVVGVDTPNGQQLWSLQKMVI